MGHRRGTFGLWGLLVVAACASRGDPGGGPGGGLPPPVDGPRAPAVCAGVPCGSGQLCCYTTGQCFDPAAADTCPRDDADAGPGSTGLDPTRDGAEPPCASDADCRPTEFCDSAGGYCTGPGHCHPRNNCGTCGPVGSPGCQTCACDGVTYPSIQAACAAGVRVSGFHVGGTCGLRQTSRDDAGAPLGPPVQPCGTDAQCDVGTRCCALYGYCVDPACPDCCAPPPPGTRLPCRTNFDCGNWSFGFCDGAGCGTPGGCVFPGSPSDCGGELEPVCGCDGHSYANACWARVASTRVAHTGMCGDAGGP